MTNPDGDFQEWSKRKALDHMPVPPKYLVAADLKWYDDRLGSCGFCQWIFRCDQDIEKKWEDNPKSPAEDYTIWVTHIGNLSHVTGLPEGFTVYLKNNVTNHGHKASWKACWDHAYLAYLDYQQIMLDELHDWDKTDRWMQKRSGRI